MSSASLHGAHGAISGAEMLAVTGVGGGTEAGVASEKGTPSVEKASPTLATFTLLLCFLYDETCDSRCVPLCGDFFL